MKQEFRPVHWLFVVLLGVTVMILIVDVRVSMKVAARIEQVAFRESGCTCLPLPSLPVRLIHEDPRCAQKILDVMNVTNVRVVESQSRVPGFDPQIAARLANLTLGYRP